jgi:hypothetical protein
MPLMQLVDDMRKEANDLREDTLTSMVGDVCNQRMAAELDKWADKLSYEILMGQL